MEAFEKDDTVAFEDNTVLYAAHDASVSQAKVSAKIKVSDTQCAISKNIQNVSQESQLSLCELELSKVMQELYNMKLERDALKGEATVLREENCLLKTRMGEKDGQLKQCRGLQQKLEEEEEQQKTLRKEITILTRKVKKYEKDLQQHTVYVVQKIDLFKKAALCTRNLLEKLELFGMRLNKAGLLLEGEKEYLIELRKNMETRKSGFGLCTEEDEKYSLSLKNDAEKRGYKLNYAGEPGMLSVPKKRLRNIETACSSFPVNILNIKKEESSSDESPCSTVCSTSEWLHQDSDLSKTLTCANADKLPKLEKKIQSDIDVLQKVRKSLADFKCNLPCSEESYLESSCSEDFMKNLDENVTELSKYLPLGEEYCPSLFPVSPMPCSPHHKVGQQTPKKTEENISQSNQMPICNEKNMLTSSCFSPKSMTKRHSFYHQSSEGFEPQIEDSTTEVTSSVDKPPVISSTVVSDANLSPTFGYLCANEDFKLENQNSFVNPSFERSANSSICTFTQSNAFLCNNNAAISSVSSKELTSPSVAGTNSVSSPRKPAEKNVDSKKDVFKWDDNQMDISNKCDSSSEKLLIFYPNKGLNSPNQLVKDNSDSLMYDLPDSVIKSNGIASQEEILAVANTVTESVCSTDVQVNNLEKACKQQSENTSINNSSLNILENTMVIQNNDNKSVNDISETCIKILPECKNLEVKKGFANCVNSFKTNCTLEIEKSDNKIKNSEFVCSSENMDLEGGLTEEGENQNIFSVVDEKKEGNSLLAEEKVPINQFSNLSDCTYNSSLKDKNVIKRQKNIQINEAVDFSEKIPPHSESKEFVSFNSTSMNKSVCTINNLVLKNDLENIETEKAPQHLQNQNKRIQPVRKTASKSNILISSVSKNHMGIEANNSMNNVLKNSPVETGKKQNHQNNASYVQPPRKASAKFNEIINKSESKNNSISKNISKESKLKSDNKKDNNKTSKNNCSCKIASKKKKKGKHKKDCNIHLFMKSSPNKYSKSLAVDLNNKNNSNYFQESLQNNTNTVSENVHEKNFKETVAVQNDLDCINGVCENDPHILLNVNKNSSSHDSGIKNFSKIKDSFSESIECKNQSPIKDFSPFKSSYHSAKTSDISQKANVSTVVFESIAKNAVVTHSSESSTNIVNVSPQINIPEIPSNALLPNCITPLKGCFQNGIIKNGLTSISKPVPPCDQPEVPEFSSPQKVIENHLTLKKAVLSPVLQQCSESSMAENVIKNDLTVSQVNNSFMTSSNSVSPDLTFSPKQREFVTENSSTLVLASPENSIKNSFELNNANGSIVPQVNCVRVGKRCNSYQSSIMSDEENALIISEDPEEEQNVPSEEVNCSEGTNTVKLGNKSSSETRGTKNKKSSDFAGNVEKRIKTDENDDNFSRVFEEIEKLKFDDSHIKRHIHTLINVFINPANVPNTVEAVFHVVKYLSSSRRNPIMAYSHCPDSTMMLPSIETCIVLSLVQIEKKQKPHLINLLTTTVNTLYILVLTKNSIPVYGLGAFCRILTELCKHINNERKPISLCCDLLKMKHKYGPYLVTSVMSVWKELFTITDETPDLEKIFHGSIVYGVTKKTQALPDYLWKSCQSVLKTHTTAEEFDVTDTINSLGEMIFQILDEEPFEEEYMIKEPLVIIAAFEGWSWTQENLLNNFIVPHLQKFSVERHERAFLLFCELYTEIALTAPDYAEPLELLKELFFEGNGYVKHAAGCSLIKIFSCKCEEPIPEYLYTWVQENATNFEGSPVYLLFQRRAIAENPNLTRDDVIRLCI